VRIYGLLGGGALALSAMLACNRSRDSNALTSDTAAAAGEVSSDSATVGTVFHGVKYPLTSENYRKWTVAQTALDSIPEPMAMPRVDLRDPTDDDIERTVDFLSHQDAARRAIERSGLSVKDFVLTSIALGQAFNFARDDLVPRDNRAFVDSNRSELVRVREARRFHVLDDDEDDDHDGEHERGHGKGHEKGHGHHHKGGHGHGHKD
jgi:hypothetical protein